MKRVKQARIAKELRDFLAKYDGNVTMTDLARESGVMVVYISRLVSGKQEDILSTSADALRDAMRKISKREDAEYV